MPHGYLNIADWIVIFLHLAGMIGMGVWFGKHQRNARDYLLGSRNLPWWSAGACLRQRQFSYPVRW